MYYYLKKDFKEHIVNIIYSNPKNNNYKEELELHIIYNVQKSDLRGRLRLMWYIDYKNEFKAPFTTEWISTVRDDIMSDIIETVIDLFDSRDKHLAKQILLNQNKINHILFLADGV